MYFWQTKKIISTGSETVMAAAENTGQDPVISVACKALSPAARVYFASPVRNVVA